MTLKPSQLAEAIRACVSGLLALLITSKPGIGKSSIARQVAEALGIGFLDVRLTTMDLVDLRGLPIIAEDGTTRWARPGFLPSEGRGILFLDELTAAPPAMQVAGYELVLDRRVGEHKLGDGWAIVAAGNRIQDGAGAVRMNTALTNRFISVTVEPDLNDWAAWALKTLDREYGALVVAFNRFRSELHHVMPASGETAYPTPRSWVKVASILALKCSKAVEYALIAGAVGDGAANEFVSFREIWTSLPSPDSIIMSPATVRVPTDNEPALRYAVAFALAARATAQNFGAIITYLDRLPEEYNVLAVKAATDRDPQLCATEAFTSWAVNHADSLN